MQNTIGDFKTFYTEYSNFIRSVLFRLVGDQLLDDAVQECFLKAWKYRDSFKGNSSVKTWLYRIATNTAIDMLRKKPLTQQLSDDFQALKEQSGDLKRDLQKIMLLLPLDFRLVVVSVIFEEMSLKEASEALNIPEGTVKSRLFRGREILRNELKIRGYDNE